jgi:hypothetical protein
LCIRDRDTTPFLVTLKRFLQPLTLMWILLATLLVFTAVHGARTRRQKNHPYPDRIPITNGVVRTTRELDGIRRQGVRPRQRHRGVARGLQRRHLRQHLRRRG